MLTWWRKFKFTRLTALKTELEHIISEIYGSKDEISFLTKKHGYKYLDKEHPLIYQYIITKAKIAKLEYLLNKNVELPKATIKDSI